MLMFRNYLNKRKGFTLLELIVVIVILGLLAALAIPTFKSIIAKTQDSKAAFELQALARQNVAVSKFTPDAPHLDNLRVWAESNKENNKSQLDTVAKFNDQTPANTEATLISQMGAVSPEYGYYSMLLPSDKASDINLAMRSASGNCVSVIVGNQNASLVKTTVKPYEATGANACTAANANAGEVEEETPGNEILAVNERIQTPQGVSKTLSLREANSVYINGPLDVLSATKPANGSTAVSNGDIEYTPDADFIGQDQFSYVISNGTISAKGLITVDVTEKINVNRAVVIPNSYPNLTEASNHDNYVYGQLFGDSKLNDELTLNGGTAGQAGFIGLLKADGVWAWANEVVSSGPSQVSQVIHRGDNSYVVGTFQGELSLGGFNLASESEMPFVGKINEAGQWLWVKQITIPLSVGAPVGDIDANGNFVMIGSFSESVTIGDETLVEQNPAPSETTSLRSTFLAKLSSAGEVVWLKAFENDSKTDSRIVVNEIVSDSSGNFYLAGKVSGDWVINGHSFSGPKTSSAESLMIARLNTNGEMIWVKTSDTTTTSTSMTVAALTRDASGYLYLAASPIVNDGEVTINNVTFTPEDQNASAIIKISPAGNWAWVQKVNQAAGVTTMSFNENNQLKVFGKSQNSPSASDAFGLIVNPSNGSMSTPAVFGTSNTITYFTGFSTNLSGTGTVSGLYMGQGSIGSLNLGDSNNAVNGFVVDMSESSGLNF